MSSSPVRNVSSILYSPGDSTPSSPAATSIPGLAGSPKSHRSSPRRPLNKAQGFDPMSSPVRAALSGLSVRSKATPISPETRKAKKRIPKIRNLTSIGKARKKTQAAFVAACQAVRQSAENGRIAQVMEHPLVNPRRGDTSVYPTDSDELADKEKWMRRIDAAAQTGLKFAPGDLIGLPTLPLPAIALTVGSVAREAADLASQRPEPLPLRPRRIAFE